MKQLISLATHIKLIKRPAQVLRIEVDICVIFQTLIVILRYVMAKFTLNVIVLW